MMKRMERSKSWTSDYWKEFSDCLNSVLVKHFVTTCVICDHTCWPQWLPQMLFRGCFRAILIVLSLSFSLCVCVCLCLCVHVPVHGLSSYLHCEWATEQHLEKDKRIQQKIKRFKIKQAQRALFFADVRLWDCVHVDILCTVFLSPFLHILGIWYEQVYVFTVTCLFTCVKHA